MTPKIVHICGTMGSGKTTLVRAFMARHNFKPIYTTGRTRALYYRADTMAVGGSYEVSTASGMDTIKDTEAGYALIKRLWGEGLGVLYEGLFMMNHTRGLELWRATQAVTVLELTTSPEDCRAGVVARRAAVGETGPLPKNFEAGLAGNRVRAQNYTYKMRAVGCPTKRITREDGLARIVELMEA